MNKNLLALALGLIFLPAAARAAGIAISPARLDVSVAFGRTTAAKITVANPTADELLFEISADEFSESIRPTPASFTLAAGARKEVTLAIGFRGAPAGEVLKTDLSVVGKPLVDTRFKANTGVKIPLTITVTAANHGLWGLWLTGAGVGILIIGIYVFLRRKKSGHHHGAGSWPVN